MRAVVTVTGKDKKGIIAKVSGFLAEKGVNIEDISQTILDEYFAMIMIVDISSANQEISELSKECAELGKKIGIHAFGQVGRNVARIAKGFGMDVMAFDPYCPDEAMIEAGVTPVKDVNTLYKECQFISLHIPATNETKKSINYALLNQMPKGAVLINTARKEVINEEELIQFMQIRKDFKYVTDIMPAADQKMQELFEGRYFATPKKMGAQTAEANINAGIAAAKQIVDYLENGNTKFQVNK